MSREDVAEIVRRKGLQTRSMSKQDLIKALQAMEDSLACFGRPDAFCPKSCPWRSDCR